MGISRIANTAAAALVSLPMVLAAGSAVAEESDAERCAGFPVAAEDTVTGYKDKLLAYNEARKQYHLDNGDNAITAWGKAKLDAAYCADQAEGLVEQGEDLLEDGIEGGKDLLDRGLDWWDQLNATEPPGIDA